MMHLNLCDIPRTFIHVSLATVLPVSLKPSFEVVFIPDACRLGAAETTKLDIKGMEEDIQLP